VSSITYPENMDTDVIESRLTRVCSFFTTHADGTSIQDVVNELRTCERELVAHRFARSRAADGRPIRVRVAAVDAALIHVSRALTLVGDGAQAEEARVSVEHAREEIAHIPAFA
jgi:hypothetical protein